MQPFRDIDLRNTLLNQCARMKKKVDEYTNDEILANDLELLADNLYEEFYVAPVTIFEEEFAKRSVTQSKITRKLHPFERGIYGHESVTLDGFDLSFFFPYEGEDTLFRSRASTGSLSPYPDITLHNKYIVLKYSKTVQEMNAADAREGLLREVENDINAIKQGISYANSNVESFNKSLRSTALAYLKEKKKITESFYSVASMFEVPVTKTSYSATHLPLKRKIVPISHTYDRQSIYCISDKDYNDILETIKHTGSTYERTPASYISMHEEDLRNTLLATLNATYKGDATGEAFRNHGKTDICIERENRAAFVAECKMWTGPKEVQAALEQLDSYLTWRDCKTALIYFVRRKNFISILDSVEETLRDIPFIRQVTVIDKNEIKCCMISESNPGQLVHVRVMLFNLYS